MSDINILKKVTILVISVLILCSASISIYAIDFNAQDKYNAVFVIYSGNNLGSGFAIGENCIISNAHVVDNKSKIQLTSYSGDKYDADIISINKALDIVVLKVSGAKFPYLTPADYRSYPIGSDVYAIGAPNSMAYTLKKGVLSAIDRKIGEYSYLQLDAAINSGNSGGPLLNDKGDVIGVNTLTMNDSEGIALAIPITAVLDYLDQEGIDLNNSGDAEATARNEDNDVIPADVPKNNNTLFWVFIITGAAAMIFVIFMVVYMIIKNRTIKPKLDKTDRTDFDIDIFE